MPSQKKNEHFENPILPDFSPLIGMASGKFKYESCSLQIKLPDEYIETVQEWSRKHIADDIIFNSDYGTYGRDTRSHITISLGLRDDCIPEYESIVKEYIGTELSTSKVTVFETKKFDAIVLGVLADDALTQMHSKLTSLANPLFARKHYTPHVSIAFVKPGIGKKILKQLSWADLQPVQDYSWTMDEIELVTREGSFITVSKGST
jgi:hypothetical protein